MMDRKISHANLQSIRSLFRQQVFRGLLLFLLLQSTNIHAQTSPSLRNTNNEQVVLSVTEPFEISDIAAVEQGVVQKILVEKGQRISANQVLAELDQGILLQSRKLAELKANAKAAIEARKAELDLRKAQQRNMDSLKEKGHANPFEVEQINTRFQQALAEYNGALEQQQIFQAELARIDKEISRRAIRSPISGIVTEIHKRPGEAISLNEPEFATVVQLDRLRVRFYLNAESISKLKPEQKITVYVGQHQQSTSAIIEFVSPIVEPKTGLAHLDVLIVNRALNIRSGIPCSWRKLTAEELRLGRHQVMNGSTFVR